MADDVIIPDPPQDPVRVLPLGDVPVLEPVAARETLTPVSDAQLLADVAALRGPAGPPGPPGPPGPAGVEVAHTRRIDTVDATLVYVGEALPGTDEASSGWTVRKVLFDESGAVTSVLVATGAWSARATLAYS